MYITYLILHLIGFLLFLYILPSSLEDLPWFKKVCIVIVGICYTGNFFLVGDIDTQARMAKRGYLSPVSVMEIGKSYDLLTSGELETKNNKTTYWLIIKDDSQQFHALTSTEKPPTSSMVVISKDSEDYHLLSYQKEVVEQVEEKPVK